MLYALATIYDILLYDDSKKLKFGRRKKGKPHGEIRTNQPPRRTQVINEKKRKSEISVVFVTVHIIIRWTLYACTSLDALYRYRQYCTMY